MHLSRFWAIANIAPCSSIANTERVEPFFLRPFTEWNTRPGRMSVRAEHQGSYRPLVVSAQNRERESSYAITVCVCRMPVNYPAKELRCIENQELVCTRRLTERILTEIGKFSESRFIQYFKPFPRHFKESRKNRGMHCEMDGAIFKIMVFS